MYWSAGLPPHLLETPNPNSSTWDLVPWYCLATASRNYPRSPQTLYLSWRLAKKKDLKKRHWFSRTYLVTLLHSSICHLIESCFLWPNTSQDYMTMSFVAMQIRTTFIQSHHINVIMTKNTFSAKISTAFAVCPEPYIETWSVRTSHAIDLEIFFSVQG